MVALTRPLLSLTVRAVGAMCRPCFRQVSLSSKQVTPLTIIQARKCLMDMVGTFYKPEEGGFVTAKEDNLLPIKNSQEECPVRQMRDSYQEVIIPLGQDARVREKYISFLHGLRFGRLLEDLDTFAVWICYIHNQDPRKGEILKSPLSTVTALVDRIDLHDYTISPFKDVKMCGHVTWVGKSSMEVTMTVEQETEGVMQQMLTARFVMVSRNPETKKAAVVNPLQPEEWAMFHLGEKSKTSRQDKANTSLLRVAPSEEERHLIHSIFLETIDQNKSRPSVRVVDDIIFRKPVEIGSLLFFSSQIVYTEGSLMQVKVHAEVLDILTKSRETTNEFYFVFDSNQPDLPRVLPRTYAESMLYLDGMRHMMD